MAQLKLAYAKRPSAASLQSEALAIDSARGSLCIEGVTCSFRAKLRIE